VADTKHAEQKIQHLLLKICFRLVRKTGSWYLGGERKLEGLGNCQGSMMNVILEIEECRISKQVVRGKETERATNLGIVNDPVGKVKLFGVHSASAKKKTKIK
jgi:hypothetical protein